MSEGMDWQCKLPNLSVMYYAGRILLQLLRRMFSSSNPKAGCAELICVSSRDFQNAFSMEEQTLGC